MATGQYKFKWRIYYSSIVIRDNLYVWGGLYEDLPLVHDNEEKRKFTSSVDIFRLPTSKWERESTTGTPPSGVLEYACTHIGNTIYYFGGSCEDDDCYHNNLYELNTITNKWAEIVNSTPDNVPMRKDGCGMISFNINGKDKLLLVGGYGPTPVTTHSHSQYAPDPDNPNRWYTNEIHLMCVSSSPGQWIVPVITGTRPPPCTGFTLHTLPGNRGVMFGGVTIEETGEHRVDDVFLLTYSQDTIDFQKVVKPGDTRGKWPKGRSLHASTIIKTISSNKQDTFHLLVSGGLDENEKTLTDCWILNLSSLKWFQIDLPESVTKRWGHSLSTFYISKECVWVVVTGGWRVDIVDDDDDLVTEVMIVELVHTPDNQWSVGNIMDSIDIGKKDQYQKRLTLALPDSSSTSRVSDNSREKDRQIDQLTHQLRESEESRQEVSQRLEHVRREIQQERNQQQRDIQEKNRQLEDKNEQLRLKIIENEQLQESVRDLRESDNHHREQLHLKNIEIQQLQENNRDLRESDNHQRETISRLQRNSQDSQQAMEALRDTNEQLQQENRELRSNIETPHWVIGREELQMTRQEIGGGAYGKVNIAVFRGTRVAAKSLHEVIISEYNLGVFTREMEISSRIHHPNIVQFLGATRVNNPILLYELMTTSLHKKIQEARLTQPQIIDVSSDITSALAYLHMWKPHPIIHRDVSSPNVLMEPSGNDRWRSKLSDFGSANLQSRVKTEIPGNPAYASPEAGIPDNHTPAMDIYSLGVVIMEMILHQPPEMTTVSRERQAQSIQWRPMKALVLRCINNDRTQRPKTVQVLDVLKQI